MKSEIDYNLYFGEPRFFRCRKNEELADKFYDLARFIEDNGFPSRHRAVAINRLEEACFLAKKAIAINEDVRA